MSTLSVPPAIRDDDERWLRARVEFVHSSLPLSMVLNPIWAALAILPLCGPFPAFGVVPVVYLTTFVGLHLGTAFLAVVVHRVGLSPDSTPRRTFRWLVALQVCISFAWGVGAVLFWVDGNAANNAFIALAAVSTMWAMALNRSVHPVLFAAGLLPLTVMFWLRAAFGEGEAAALFTIFTPVFMAYSWFMGASARARVNELLRTRFELEDMAQDLHAARGEAMAKTAEAEAASASKSAFLANMSHELRTPLNAILGFAEVIEREAVGPEVSAPYRSYAGDIRESGAHLLSLINDMLDIAKIESGKMEIDRQALDAREAIDAAVRLITQRAEAKRQTISVAPAAGVRVLADERALKQILLNLLSNAVKFSPDRSTIHVRCEDGRGVVRFVIDDAGPGIPGDKIKQLFKPFARVDNRYDRSAGGTGLGLALVRGLTALHGGRVWLENKAGGGLAATVELPAAEAAARVA